MEQCQCVIYPSQGSLPTQKQSKVRSGTESQRDALSCKIQSFLFYLLILLILSVYTKTAVHNRQTCLTPFLDEENENRRGKFGVLGMTQLPKQQIKFNSYPRL